MSEGKRLESELFSLLYEQGAGLAGAGDLTGLVEGKMNIGISVAIPVPKHIVRDLQTALTRSGLGWIGKTVFLSRRNTAVPSASPAYAPMRRFLWLSR